MKKPDTMFSSLNQKECQYYELQSFMTQSTHLPVRCLGFCLPPLHTDRQFAALSRQVTVEEMGQSPLLEHLPDFDGLSPQAAGSARTMLEAKQPLMRPWKLQCCRSG